jgi:hypothetical protein
MVYDEGNGEGWDVNPAPTYRATPPRADATAQARAANVVRQLRHADYKRGMGHGLLIGLAGAALVFGLYALSR